MKRRDVLIGGAAVVAACGVKPPPDGPRVIIPGDYDHATQVQFTPDTLTQADTLFPLGIQAGAVRQDGALLWTFAEGATSARLRVWRDGDSAGTVALAKDLDVSAANGFLSSRLDGLAPATWYRYAFFDAALAQRTAVGRFRTAFPDDWKEPFTLGAAACTNFRFQPYRALEFLAQQELDAFVHLGDIAYLDAGTSEPELRDLWRRTLTDPGYRALLASTSWYATWDDHELENDFNPETPRDPARLAINKRMFFETLAVEQNEQGSLWRSYRWGGTAELFVLDSRSERKPSTIGTPQATYLSRAQMDWLKGALSQSQAHFKVVLNSVPIANMPPPLWGNQNDRWQGYTAARDELLDHITGSDIRNVYFLSGDFHLGLVMRVEKEGPRRRLWEVACGPGGNGNNPLVLVWESPQNRETGFPKAQFEYCGGQPAATTLRFDPKGNAVTVRFLDPATGEVRFEKVLSELT